MASTIILSDNGASSGSAGLKQTAGNDGVLILQTTTSGGTATNAVYVDTSQNVGLGGTPSYKLDVTSGSTNTLRLKGSGSLSLYSYHDSSGVGFTNASPYSGGALLYFYNGQTELYSSGTAVFRVTSGNSLSLEGATPKAGTGITFPATQSASTDANTLDDYEEGTFTPTVLGFSTPGTGTYTGRLGRYTKIGNRVYIQMWVDWSNLSGASGALGFGGLPFTAPNTAYVYNALVCYMDGPVTLSANNVIQCYIPINDSRVLLTQYATGGGAAATVTLDSAGALMICGWYEPA